MPNRPRLIVHYLACFRAGLVATPLNYRYTVAEIDHALEVSGARALLVHAEREPDLAESRLAGTLPLGRIGYPRPSSDGVSLDQLMEGEPTAAALPRPASLAPGRDLLHVRQHRPAQGRHPHPRDARLDACDRGRRSRAAGRRPAAGRLVAVARRRLLCLLRRAQRRRLLVVARSFDGDELLPLLRDGQADGAVDAALGAVRAHPRPRRPPARTSPRCGCAAPPATTSRPSSSASSPSWPAS